MSSLTTKTTKSRSAAPSKLPPKAVKKTAKKDNSKSVPIKNAAKGKSVVISKAAKQVSPNKKVAKAKVPVKVSVAPKSTPPKKVTAGKSSAKSAKAPLKKGLANKPQKAVKPAPVPQKKLINGANMAAVQAFEQALRLFNKHDYAGAKAAFERILEKFSEQTEVLPGVRKYLTISEQKVARIPSTPKNPDALYDQGVFELNRANVREAIQLLEKALKAQPKGAHILYSLAAAYARLSESYRALDFLRQAIYLQSVHRSRARSDTDFASLHNSEEFQQMTGFGIGYIED
jgi:tetratricopeptide (TPR) repeat protein